ncbi:Nif3-like dinuclear metal center hexameric protein [Streptococcaceae bacterium ESL0687]|nr:Nif3-like dinuclear metal center hexameric protein [Streptococcaceae bacterium ESL0687]
MIASDFFKAYESFCPQELSMKDDACGLQVGSLDGNLKRVLVTLDIREETVQEAIDLKVDCILAKHAIIFRPLASLNAKNPQEKMILDLVRAGISVYVSHTNIDIVNGGLNDYFCQELAIKNTTYLTETSENQGIGRIGDIEAESLASFIERAKKAFDLETIRLVSYTGDQSTSIRRVAICGGSGGSFYKDALKKGADLYITGDIYYHTGQDMLSQGLLALDPGHYIEKAFIPLVAAKLRELTSGVEIFESRARTNPFMDL